MSINLTPKEISNLSSLEIDELFEPLTQEQVDALDTETLTYIQLRINELDTEQDRSPLSWCDFASFSKTDAPDGLYELRWTGNSLNGKASESVLTQAILVKNGIIVRPVAFSAISHIYNLNAWSTDGGILQRYFIESLTFEGDHFSVNLGS